MFVDPENTRLIPTYERIYSKNCRGTLNEQRAHTVDDFMKGNDDPENLSTKNCKNENYTENSF